MGARPPRYLRIDTGAPAATGDIVAIGRRGSGPLRIGRRAVCTGRGYLAVTGAGRARPAQRQAIERSRLPRTGKRSWQRVWNFRRRGAPRHSRRGLSPQQAKRFRSTVRRAVLTAQITVGHVVGCGAAGTLRSPGSTAFRNRSHSGHSKRLAIAGTGTRPRPAID